MTIVGNVLSKYETVNDDKRKVVGCGYDWNWDVKNSIQLLYLLQCRLQILTLSIMKPFWTPEWNFIKLIVFLGFSWTLWNFYFELFGTLILKMEHLVTSGLNLAGAHFCLN